MNGVPFSEKEVSYNGGYAKFIINQTIKGLSKNRAVNYVTIRP